MVVKAVIKDFVVVVVDELTALNITANLASADLASGTTWLIAINKYLTDLVLPTIGLSRQATLLPMLIKGGNGVMIPVELGTEKTVLNSTRQIDCSKHNI